MLGRILDRLIDAFAFFSGAMLLFALVAVSVDVVMRYFFNNPMSWVLQVSEYILLYMPFMAAAYVLKGDGHIKVDIVLNRLAPKSQARFNMYASFLGFLVIGVMAYYGSKVTWEQYQRGIVTMEHVKMPQFLVTMAIPLGSILFALQFLRRAGDYRKELNRTDKSLEDPEPSRNS